MDTLYLTLADELGVPYTTLPSPPPPLTPTRSGVPQWHRPLPRLPSPPPLPIKSHRRIALRSDARERVPRVSSPHPIKAKSFYVSSEHELSAIPPVPQLPASLSSLRASSFSSSSTSSASSIRSDISNASSTQSQRSAPEFRRDHARAASLVTASAPNLAFKAASQSRPKVLRHKTPPRHLDLRQLRIKDSEECLQRVYDYQTNAYLNGSMFAASPPWREPRMGRRSDDLRDMKSSGLRIEIPC